MGINTSSWVDEGFDSVKLSHTASESSEQYSERAKRTQSQLKRIQKDEKFARADNEKLFLILSRFIQTPYYEGLIPDVSALLTANISSRGIIAFLALFYPDAAYFIADSVGKKEKIYLLLGIPKMEQEVYFDEKNLHPDMKKWITEWIVLMEEFLIQDIGSVLMLKNFLQDISVKEKNLTIKTLARFLQFFMLSRNIKIADTTCQEYAQYVHKNLKDIIAKYLAHQEEQVQRLIQDTSIDPNALFG